jgi:hypothetical protein
MYSETVIHNCESPVRPRTKVMTRYTPESASGLQDT